MYHSRTAFLAASTFFSAASMAGADVSADDIWNDFTSYVSGIGYEMTGTQTRSGNVLTAEDVRISGDLGPEVGSVYAALGTMTLIENGDGTVSVVFPDTIPITSTFTMPDGETATTTTEYRQEGALMTASGTPANLRYDYVAEAASITSRANDLASGENIFDAYTFSVDLKGIEGVTTMLLGSARDYDQTLNVADAIYTMLFQVDDGTTDSRITGTLSDVAFSGKSAVPLSVASALNLNSMLGAGLSVDGTFTTGQYDVSFEASLPDGLAMTGEVSSATSTLDVEMSQDGLSYEAKQTGIEARMTLPMLPFPIAFSAEASSGGLSIPLRANDTAGDFSLGLLLSGFSMDEALWALFDPAAQLPRDPATLNIQLSGTADLMIDIFDPASLALAETSGTAPAEIQSVNLDALQLSVAGADLTGSGAFTFDNSAPAGPPKPIGGIDLMLAGGNGLLDRLVSIGLLPEEQAIAARMMMGLLAVPGNTPDTLNSRIDINEQGHIIANGQRIR